MERPGVTGAARRLGFLGGTFDPPHIGHLLLAETARQQLKLERVCFLPAGEPPHKQDEPVSPVAQRMRMTEMAIADNPHFALDAVDAERPAPHYTSTLLPLLHDRYPESEIWLLIGGDSLSELPAWHKPQEVLANCRLAALPRPGATISWEELEAALPGVREAVAMLDGPAVAVSSTRIREWAADGHSLRYLVAPEVRALIARERLYCRK